MQVLESRLVEKMRFELGAIYNVSAGVDFSISHAAAGQPIKGNASVSYTCEPGQVAALAALVLNELALLKAHGPAEEEVAKRAEISRRAHETDVKYNSWWLERLTTSFTVRCYTGSLPQSFQVLERSREEVLAALAPATVQGAFARFFPDLDRHTLVTLKPNLATQAASAVKIQLEALLGGRQLSLLTVALGCGGGLVAASGVALLVLLRARRCR